MLVASRCAALSVAMPTTSLTQADENTSPSTPTFISQLTPPFLSSHGRRRSSSYELLVAATGSLLHTPATIKPTQLSNSEDSTSRTPDNRRDWLTMRGGALHLHSMSSSSRSHRRRPKPSSSSVPSRSLSYTDMEDKTKRTGFDVKHIGTSATVPNATVFPEPVIASSSVSRRENGRMENAIEMSSNSIKRHSQSDQGMRELPY